MINHFSSTNYQAFFSYRQLTCGLVPCYKPAHAELRLSVPFLLLAQGPLAGASIIRQIGPFGWFVLLVLLFFMASAFGLIAERILYLRRAQDESRRFLAIFRKSARFSEVKGACSELRRSPLVGLFLAASAELDYQLKSTSGTGEGAAPTIRNLEAISRALQRASSVEIARLERGVPFLATTATVTPFIGLLGTVVGIMSAFMDIGRQGTAGLEVVAPGIAEALINTAAGLAAAIPAVIAYNYLVTRTKQLAAEMDDFSLEFVSITERNFSE